MTNQEEKVPFLLLPLAGWLVPIVAVVLLVVPIWLDGSRRLCVPDWIFSATAISCAVLVPLFLGVSISCFALRSCVSESRFRRHSLIGVLIGTILLVLMILLFVSGERPAPFLYAW